MEKKESKSFEKIAKAIKKTPIIGSLTSKVYRKIKGISSFTNSGEYWEERYRKGGDSGAGSYNKLAEHKGEIINDFTDENNISSVIEFGCGDGNQLKYFRFKEYIGFDVSTTILDNCRTLFKKDKTKQFFTVDQYVDHTADLTMSLDVIYHLIEDDVYANYMKILFAASNKYVIVYSSNSDQHENNGVSPHVKHRNFMKWVDENANEFKLIKHIPNKYQYMGDDSISTYADFYIFKK